MAVPAQRHPTTTTTLGGALVALAGLLELLRYLAGDVPAIPLLASVALAVGCVVLASGPGSVVGASRIGRVALVVLGVGPLASLLPIERTPWPVVLGMSEIVLITIATVVAAVSVARAGVVRGVARWALVVVAVDALLTALMSSVLLGDLPFVYLALDAGLIRPVALLVWGMSLLLHGRSPAIRRRATAINAAWKRTTEVGGAATEAPEPVEIPR